MTNEGNTFSSRLEQALRTRRMTQKELANKAGVTEAAMSHYIRGDRIPRSSVLARITVNRSYKDGDKTVVCEYKFEDYNQENNGFNETSVLETTSDYLMEGTPQCHEEEIGYAKRLIARNVERMTTAEKREILSILLGGQED